MSTESTTVASSELPPSSPIVALVEFGMTLAGILAGGLLILLGIGLCRLFFWLEAVSVGGFILVGLCFLGGALLSLVSALLGPCTFFAHRMYWAGSAACLLLVAVGYRLIDLWCF